MKSIRSLFRLCAALPLLAVLSHAADGLRHVAGGEGAPAAVVVDDRALVFTRQVFGVNSDAPSGTVDAREQTREALRRLEIVLKAAGADVKRVVRVHAYVSDANVTPIVLEEVGRFFKSGSLPAVTTVAGQLPLTGAVVALDAVAALAGTVNVAATKRVRASALPATGATESHAAVLPRGPSVYISGRAEPGDVERATRDTMAKLGSDLETLGLGAKDIVQLKAFVSPISAAAVARRQIEAYFGDKPMPPLVFAEWHSSSRPVEIELVAAGAAKPTDAKAPGVEYITPPGNPTNPLFTRIVRVNRGPLIFTSGLFAGEGDAETQVRAVLVRLKEVLAAAGSDFDHMVKATYYVADEPASSALNKVRRELYNPKRPPAASKVQVTGTGREGRPITLDMIAVGR